MEYDWDKVDEAVMALLYLTLHEVNEHGGRVWKGHDFDVLDRLHAKGWIGDARGKSKSVALDAEGMARAKELFEKWFGRPDAGAAVAPPVAAQALEGPRDNSQG